LNSEERGGWGDLNFDSLDLASNTVAVEPAEKIDEQKEEPLPEEKKPEKQGTPIQATQSPPLGGGWNSNDISLGDVSEGEV